jgi:hypothetical protein
MHNTEKLWEHTSQDEAKQSKNNAQHRKQYYKDKQDETLKRQGTWNPSRTKYLAFFVMRWRLYQNKMME